MTDTHPIEPLSADALNLYRITHPDKEIRPLISRLHRLSTASLASSSSHSASVKAGSDGDVSMEGTTQSGGEDDKAEDVDLVKLDLLKWQRNIERSMASVFNLQTQKLFYEEKAKQTAARTEELRIALQNEKLVLERKLRDREGMLKCDVVARKITSKGKSRAELDEQIAELEESLENHRSTNEAYIAVAQARSDKLKEVIQLVEDVRNIKLPDTAPIPETENDSMDVDPKEESGTGDEPSSASSRMNGSALPFQPQTSQNSAPSRPSAHTNGSASSPVTRATTPTPSGPSASTSTSNSNTNSRHALPTRPSRPAAASSSSRNIPNPSLPSRPSNLRSVTGPRGGSGGNLEEGEVGGEEEGEVNERGSKRVTEPAAQRVTRSRQ